MVKHIVMFKLKESLSENEKIEIMNNFKSAIEALPQTIKFIKDIHVGLNINPSEKWDICLDSTLITWLRLELLKMQKKTEHAWILKYN